MAIRRFVMGLVAAALLASICASPALAKKPAPTPIPEAPLTAEQIAASDAKFAAAAAYVAAEDAKGGPLASLACVPIAAPSGKGGAGGPADGPRGASPSGLPAGCSGVPQGYLPVEARDQAGGHYCGPAVGQVIANYTWAMRSGADKFSQKTIAGWMKTDLHGQTTFSFMEAGLETATAGAPRRPGNWDWLVSALNDANRNGTAGDELHTVVRSNISSWRMPVAISVKPHDVHAQYRLASWPRPVNSVGHYVAIYGWMGLFNGTDSARVYYTDSSKDEGGSTGKFWDPTRHIAAMILAHTQLYIW